MSGKTQGGTPRRNPGVRGRRPDRKEIRCDGVRERTEARATLSAADQLARLDRRLGKGVGAKRERARLVKS